MSLASSDSPIPDDELRRRPPIPHQPPCFGKLGPIQYDPKSCYQCGQYFKYGQSKYEFSSDPKLTWKHLCAEITRHLDNCPANTNSRTSAIRDTLIEPSVGKWRGKEKMSSTSSFAPYSLPRPSRREICRDDEGCSRRHDMRYASPESSFVSRRATTPEPVDSSHRAAPHSAYHGATTPTPHSSTRGHETYERSLIVPAETSRQPLRPLNQRPLSLAFLVATDPEPVILSSSHVDKLPPLYKLKRKLSEFQDAQAGGGPRLPRKSTIDTGPRGASFVTHARSPALRADPPEPPTILHPVDYEEDPEPPEKKFKKNIMDWRLRQKELEEDELLSAVEAKQVFCKLCVKWIKLDARNDFYPGLWKKHRKTMHEASDKPEDRKRCSRVGGDASLNVEHQLSVRKRRTTGHTCARLQERPSEQDARNLVLDTRLIRSSSRITRSSSGTSN